MGVSTRSRRRAVSNTDRPSFGKADVFPAGLTSLSAQCGPRILKGEKRKYNGSFIIINKSRSAERKSVVPFLNFVPKSRSTETYAMYKKE